MKNVTARTATWFEIKARVNKMLEDGQVKTVRMTICSDSHTCTEAESNAIYYFNEQGISLEGIDQISRSRFHEVFFYAPGTKWYRAVLKFVTLDEKTEKIKLQTVYYLVQADTLDEAREIINQVMGNTRIEYIIFSITESPIEETLMHDKNIDNE